MIKISTKIRISFLFLLGILAVPQTAFADRLSGAEIQTQISGKSFNFAGQYTGWIQYRNNGSVTYHVSVVASDTGTWWIESSQLCTNYESRSPATQCVRIILGDDGTYRSSNGYTLSRR